jgi:type VI secretion system protein ImpE
VNATELYKEGKLSEAIDAQIKDVKANPADQAKRLFLFELLSFSGDLDRARRQIEAITYDEPELVASVNTYRSLLESEQARRRSFEQGVKPEFIVDPPLHVRIRIDAAINYLTEDRNPPGAADLLAKAAQASPSATVLLNGEPYENFHDADDLFGPVLEVMARGKYFWVPLEQIESVAMNPPRFPRDLVWIPARLQIKNGPQGEVFLPALYPGSHRHPDDQIKMGRMTDWREIAGGSALGVGLHMFAAGEEGISILEWRELQVLSVK